MRTVLTLILLALSALAQARDDCAARALSRELAGDKTPAVTSAPLLERVLASSDPYSTGYYLASDVVARKRELAAFQRLVDYPKSAAAQLKEISKWTKSDAHALYLYQNLDDFGPNAGMVFQYLLKENPYFRNAHRVRGPPRTLITYSFEKESKNPTLSLYYRAPGISEEAWVQQLQDPRVEQLRNITGKREKHYFTAGELPPTRLKPDVLGGLSQDYTNEGMVGGGFSWEVNHRSYEFDPDRLIGEMKEISRDLHETHSFHVHVVFDLPRKYPYFDSFILWNKQLQDYAYLKGMEEGLHGNRMTGVADLRTGRFARALASLTRPDETHVLPENISQIKKDNYKTVSVGLRRKIYGQSKSPDFDKIGLELRDVTRNMDTWADYIHSVGNAVAEQTWERAPAISRRDPKLVFLKSSDPEALDKLMSEGFDKATAKRLLKAEPTLNIALERFEEGNYFDYRTRQWIHPDAAAAERIRNARAGFVDELRKTADELRRMDAKGEDVDKGDLATVIKMDLTQWARAAQVSELYSGFKP